MKINKSMLNKFIMRENFKPNHYGVVKKWNSVWRKRLVKKDGTIEPAQWVDIKRDEIEQKIAAGKKVTGKEKESVNYYQVLHKTDDFDEAMKLAHQETQSSNLMAPPAKYTGSMERHNTTRAEVADATIGVFEMVGNIPVGKPLTEPLEEREEFKPFYLKILNNPDLSNREKRDQLRSLMQTREKHAKAKNIELMRKKKQANIDSGLDADIAAEKKRRQHMEDILNKENKSMKITKTELKKLIKEELKHILEAAPILRDKDESAYDTKFFTDVLPKYQDDIEGAKKVALARTKYMVDKNKKAATRGIAKAKDYIALFAYLSNFAMAGTTGIGRINKYKK